MELMRDYLDKEHTQYIDNFYTSVDLTSMLTSSHIIGLVQLAWVNSTKQFLTPDIHKFIAAVIVLNSLNKFVTHETVHKSGLYFNARCYKVLNVVNVFHEHVCLHKSQTPLNKLSTVNFSL